MVKTLNISEVIRMLQTIKEEYGDLPVIMSKDSEGNSYNTFPTLTDIEAGYEVRNDIVVLYPYAEHCDIEDVEGYDFDIEDVENEGYC